MTRCLAALILLLAVHPLFAEPAVFLARHAEKAQSGDPKDPDLSEAGRARATALATFLKDAGITAVYASEFKRTQETAEPLARALGLTTVIVPGKDTQALAARLKQAQGNALVVGHSDTVPEILKALGVAAPPSIADADYDNLFVLILSQPVQLLRLHYP